MARRRKNILTVQEHPIWSPTRLDCAEECMKSYWFNYIKHVPHNVNPSIARGRLIHSLIENFWKTDEKSGLLIPTSKSREGFMGRAAGDWKRNYAKTGTCGNQKIDWDYQGQQWDINYINEIRDISRRVYNRLTTEEPRLAAEVTLHVEYEGLKFMAKIDELRKDLVIRDHKSGYKTPREHYLDKNIQMTDYMLCLWVSLQDPRSTASQLYPEHTGISLEDFLETSRVEIHHLPRRRNCAPEEENITQLYPATRTVESFNDLVKATRSKESALERRDFHPTKGRHCDYCFWAKDCEKYNPEKEHEGEYEKEMPLFAHTGIENKSFGKPPQKVRRSPKQKTMRLMKKTNELRA